MPRLVRYVQSRRETVVTFVKSRGIPSMHVIRRALATLIAGAVFTVLGAASAYASPEDGEGCVGSPDIRETYICVIAVTPENAVPTTSTTTIPVPVPRLCYLVDCTDPTTVGVPVPGATPGSGQIAVLWYQGQFIPIAAGTDLVFTLLADAITLAEGAAGVAMQVADGAIAEANRIVGMLPTADEVLTEVQALYAAVSAEVARVIDSVPTVDELESLVEAVLASSIATADAFCRCGWYAARWVSLAIRAAGDPLWFTALMVDSLGESEYGSALVRETMLF